MDTLKLIFAIALGVFLGEFALVLFKLLIIFAISPRGVLG